MNAEPEAAPGQESESWLRRHRLGLLAAVLLAVGLALPAALAWHFSSAVLVPDHSPWPANVTVEQVGPGRVVLSRDADTQRPGIYGLDWTAGHGIVGDVLAQSAGSITRRLSAVRGYLVPGSKVAIDPGVFAGNPGQALGLPFVTVGVPDELGSMPAWLIPGRSATWAIVVHGINGDRQEGLRIAPALHRSGLPTLLISYRGDLGAPSSPDGMHHMGLTEWHDLEAAVRYALARGAHRVLLCGYSMGGAVIAQFMERSPLASRVAGLLLDAPALDWRSILEFNATQMGLPSFLALPVEWAIDLRSGPDWNSLDAVRQPEDFQLPILLFHGAEDSVVPISTSQAFAAELPRWVSFFEVPRADHTEAWNVDPALYDQRLISFLRRIHAATRLRSDAADKATSGSGA
ncbi:MAG TPA: alpha/beta fold hydrolase [Solirubrobacterales bacterium]|nr:alpha/beta fold hydrolase [Solirubrobacterales bacterium]